MYPKAEFPLPPAPPPEPFPPFPPVPPDPLTAAPPPAPPKEKKGLYDVIPSAPFPPLLPDAVAIAPPCISGEILDDSMELPLPISVKPKLAPPPMPPCVTI